MAGYTFNIYRRKYKRRVPKVDLRVDVWRDNHEWRKELVKIKDISEGGVKIITDTPWENGNILNLSFSQYVVVGEVRWHKVLKHSENLKYVMGLEFLDQKSQTI